MHEGDIFQSLRLREGEWWYVGLLASAGFAVGLIKVVWSCLLPKHKYPRKLPGFLVDIRELRGHDALLPWPVLACSAVSIGMGASVGPEMALGTFGTALWSLVFAQRWRLGSIQAQSATANDDNHQALLVEPSSARSRSAMSRSSAPWIELPAPLERSFCHSTWLRSW
jgi:H+/Cl- antiporter ClcA